MFFLPLFLTEAHLRSLPLSLLHLLPPPSASLPPTPSACAADDGNGGQREQPQPLPRLHRCGSFWRQRPARWRQKTSDRRGPRRHTHTRAHTHTHTQNTHTHTHIHTHGRVVKGRGRGRVGEREIGERYKRVEFCLLCVCVCVSFSPSSHTSRNAHTHTHTHIHTHTHTRTHTARFAAIVLVNCASYGSRLRTTSS